MNAGDRNSHRLQLRKPPTALLQALMSILLAPTRCSRKEAVTSISLTASTRAGSLLRDRGAIVTRHTFVMSQQPCLICGRKQSDPHHLRYLQPRALGRKASDEFAVPLCRSHHRAVHRAGDEQAWWKAAGIDPVNVARHLWRQTRLDDPQEPHQPGLAARPQTGLIASAPAGTTESRSRSRSRLDVKTSR